MSLIFAAHSGEAAAPPADADVVKAFETRIAQLDAQDARQPQALETHLRYADYLAKAPAENCASRLSTAQSQLQAAQDNVALGVVLPQGLARAADIDYQILAALAACGGTDPVQRQSDWRAAVASAQRAAALYQETFDYAAMVTMQYNAAVGYQNVGDSASAQTVLQSVIDADRRFGFCDDAAENLALLKRWQAAAQAAASEPEAARLQTCPQRAAMLRFAWTAGDSAVSLKTQYTRLIGHEQVQAQGDRTVTRQVRRRPFGWYVDYQPLGFHYSLDPLPPGTGIERSFMISLAGMLAKFHDFSLTAGRTQFGASADFNQAFNLDTFKSRARQDAQAHAAAGSLLGDSPHDARDVALGPLLDSALSDLLLPGAVEVYTALDYNLETGSWPGATLEQGQWYSMKILLPLPFSPLNFLPHEVQFAFTQELPCGHDTDRSCVELVLRAVPEDLPLKKILERLSHSLHLKGGEALRADSTLYLRLITDPDTLQTYHEDLRQHFYASFDPGSNGALLGVDRSIIDAQPTEPAAD